MNWQSEGAGWKGRGLWTDFSSRVNFHLEGYFRNKFELIGTPMAIELRTGRNPYAGKAQKKRR